MWLAFMSQLTSSSVPKSFLWPSPTCAPNPIRPQTSQQSPMAAASASCLRSLLSSPRLTAAAGSASSIPLSTPPATPLHFGFTPQGVYALSPLGSRNHQKQPFIRATAEVSAIASPSMEETKEYILPSWAEFELGIAPIFWKTMNGLPPTSGESLTLFYNPAATNLVPVDGYGIAFNGGFNQPIMCGSEPRIMTRKNRGKADPPIFTIRIRVPRYAVNLIFSFTNGTEWDGPYRLPFQPLKMWRNKPLSFFNEGLANELSVEGACDRAIFPDPNNVVTSCAIGNLYAAGGDRCKLNLVSGCMDPSSPMYNPLAIVDDGSCPLEIESDEE